MPPPFWPRWPLAAGWAVAKDALRTIAPATARMLSSFEDLLIIFILLCLTLTFGCVYRISGYQAVDERCESLGGVFLEEVTGAFDDGVWLTFGAGHAFLKNSFASRCDRVAIAKRREEWLVELVEYFPGLAIRCLLTPDQCRHDPRFSIVPVASSVASMFASCSAEALVTGPSVIVNVSSFSTIASVVMSHAR